MLEFVVRAGEHARDRPLVVEALSPELASRLGLPSGSESAWEATAIAPRVWLRIADGERAGEQVPAQYDAARGTLTWLVPTTIPAGRSATFRPTAASDDTLRSSAANQPAVHPRRGSDNSELGTGNWQLAVSLTQKLDRLIVSVGGQPFAWYNVLGARRPYFWPLLGPAGASVVRGQGTGEHPHHTGLALNYGGHSEGGSTNIWSDWDEPPYGPGGRMLHRGWRCLLSGPVYGEAVQDLTYVNAYGDPIVDEVRTIRCWFAGPDARFLDFTFAITNPRDQGTQPFMLMARLPGTMDIPNTGRITNAIGQPVPHPEGRPHSHGTYRAAWIDASGPTGDPPPLPPPGPPEELVDLPGARRRPQGPGSGPWNGVAVFDHPENHGFPGTVGKYCVVQQITQTHYPPDEVARRGGTYSIRQRVYVHDGDAEQGNVAARWRDYAFPCTVTVE